jgi:tetratricopeptide (TPR) repeat protein
MAKAIVFEEHSTVLAHWHRRGVRGATLVCLDAHLDLQFIDAARIERLARCDHDHAMRALESPHPLHPSRDACFGIEDFLYAASRLGIVRRLVWVAPPHVLAFGFSTALAGLQQMEGVTIEQLESFRTTRGGWLEGELLGLAMLIGTLPQLGALKLEQPLLLDIDADYFVEVPQDRLWCSPTQTCVALREWLGGSHELTIARSAGTGFMPPALAGIPEQVAACWEGREEEMRPAPAEDDLLATLGAVRARAQPLSLAQLMQLQRRLEAWSAAPDRLAAAWVALGLLHARFGRLADAVTCHARSADGGEGHPELALDIGRLLLVRGEAAQARPWLTRASRDDETRVQAWLLLADAALQSGDADTAAAHAQSARRAAPAWTAPWPRLAAAAALRGDREEERAARSAGLALERRLAAVAARLVRTAASPAY